MKRLTMIVLLFLSQLLFAKQITITLDGVNPDTKPCEIWSEEGIDLCIIPVDKWDCSGPPPGYWFAPDSIWLLAARIKLDLSLLTGTIKRAEVDIHDYCKIGCTQTAFYKDTATVIDYDSNKVVNEKSTLRLFNKNNEKINIMTVSSYEGVVIEIRLEVIDITHVNDDLKYSSNNFTLHQNYPNPFNPMTTITYQIEQSAFVNLSVFDLLGKHVVTLVDDQKEKGFHIVNWNAGNIESGIYYYRIISDNFSEVRKCLLLK
jgi:hypothetical protein